MALNEVSVDDTKLETVSNNSTHNDEEDCSSDSTEKDPEKDQDYVEERYRVDRRRLEQMIQEENTERNAETFFSTIMKDLNVHIAWPSKLKIGAKSKKDPHLKVSGSRESVALAKSRIMEILDTKMLRVTLKMDVCHTEHSHIIGKSGGSIQNVMRSTGCHVHFPDSNRSCATGGTCDKGSQVSIAGFCSAVDKARAMIRELSPLVLIFEVTVSNPHLMDPSLLPTAIRQIQQHYRVNVTVRPVARQPGNYVPESTVRQTVTVRGSVCNVRAMREAIGALYELFTGQRSTTFPLCMPMDVTPQHQTLLIGPDGTNVRRIAQRTGATVYFSGDGGPTAPCLPNSTVHVTGPLSSVLLARHLLLGCLPFVLLFDIKDGSFLDQTSINEIANELNVCISVKTKMKQAAKTVIIKGFEQNTSVIYEARQRILGIGSETPPRIMADNDSPRNSYDIPAFECVVPPSGAVCTLDASRTRTGNTVVYHPYSDQPSPANWTFTGHTFDYGGSFPIPVIPPPICALPPPMTHPPQPLPFQFYPPLTPGQTAAVPPTLGGRVGSPVYTNNVVRRVTPVADQVQDRAVVSQCPSSTLLTSCDDVDSNLMQVFTARLSSLSAANVSNTGNSLTTSDRSVQTTSEALGSVMDGNSIEGSESENSRHSSSLCSDVDFHRLVSNHENCTPVLRAARDDIENGEMTPAVHALLTSVDGRCSLAENTTAILNYIDYERKKRLANQAIMKKPVGESRTPTDLWAGLGFSKSMPDSEIRNKLNGSVRAFNGPTMTTTYEAVEDEELKHCDSPDGSSTDNDNSSNHGQSEQLVNSRSASNFAPCSDLSALLAYLGFQKYAELFEQQEIDISTFMTMNDVDFKELGVLTFGARRKLLLAIAELKKQPLKCFPCPPPGLPNPFTNSAVCSPVLRHLASRSGRW